MKNRVTVSGIGSMPHRAEIALANGRLARMLRHAARCNCGKGRTVAGCTTKHPRAGEAGLDAIARSAEACRARMNEYRANRVWIFSGSTPRKGKTTEECNG